MDNWVKCKIKGCISLWILWSLLSLNLVIVIVRVDMWKWPDSDQLWLQTKPVFQLKFTEVKQTRNQGMIQQPKDNWSYTNLIFLLQSMR